MAEYSIENVTIFLSECLTLGSYQRMLAMLIMSANTPAAVTSAPAP